MSQAPASATENARGLSLRVAEKAARDVHKDMASNMHANEPGSSPVIVRCKRKSASRATCRVTIIGTTQTLRDTTHVADYHGQPMAWVSDIRVAPAKR